MFVLVILLFWQARKHLTECFRKSFTRNSGIDDTKEILSYRTSVFGSILSFFAMAFFMR